MKEKLLPCPFCGKPAEVLEDSYWGTFWVGCTDRPKFKDGPSCQARTVADNRSQAIAQWNRRT